MTPSIESDISAVCHLISAKKSQNSRIIIGIAGPPASGKSTLAEAVVARLNQDLPDAAPLAALLPMDGFHLDNPILAARGLLPRKGAPETFNAHGFCEAVRQLSTTTEEIFLPRFDRQLDLAIANAIAIPPQVEIIVVEGNYLLMKDAPWSALRDVFTATVFVAPELEVLHERLIQRWLDHGLDQAAAIARATGNDLPNAELILQNSGHADLNLFQR